ncbi:acetyltransferase [Enterococcus moraviensis ATCC BAA-383]|uniref:Acetyltransferase n=1 Tax=Enterococcus moraviensis ATCC BAA-383 TaxID=1158609 RepID=R2T077_9ENTE|nr:GNAT family N-acetyltransferase [Enterococcus moraviensis]EOH98436.1 acetyltransferase [Enterococcus moraviensis ATCC BAA-383]EOT71701.1 acetyltransferase [Enterococcus moraviensis ATCC BAA-383]OJG67821.1 acetyltransferase [Enterococcus moraviensis]
MKIVHTKDTMSDIYLDAVKIRRQVFMLEQGVPGEIEIDKYEAACIHFVLYGEKNEVIATCRLLPLEDGLIKLQRMAVQKEFRGKDYGRLIVEGAELFSKEQGYNTITLGAQITALGFYERMGYIKEGELFLDANIEHYKMNKTL